MELDLNWYSTVISLLALIVTYCIVEPLKTAISELFQSTLPRGSDSIKTNYFSIHLNQAFFAN